MTYQNFVTMTAMYDMLNMSKKLKQLPNFKTKNYFQLNFFHNVHYTPLIPKNSKMQ